MEEAKKRYEEEHEKREARSLKRERERAEAIQRRKLKEQQLTRQREQRALAGRERLRRDRVESSVRAALRRRDAERRERALLVSEAVELAMHAANRPGGNRRFEMPRPRPRRRRDAPPGGLSASPAAATIRLS